MFFRSWANGWGEMGQWSVPYPIIKAVSCGSDLVCAGRTKKYATGFRSGRGVACCPRFPRARTKMSTFVLNMFRSAHTPHDAYVRLMLGVDGVMNAFVSEQLPDVAQLLTLETLQPIATDFVDRQLLPTWADKLFHAFSARSPESGAFVLVEHKSDNDRWVALQLLGYQAQIYDSELRSKKEHEFRQLTPIIPVVVYHGRERWDDPVDFAHLVDRSGGIEMATHNFGYRLVDVVRTPDGNMPKHPELRAMMISLKYVKQIKKHPEVLDVVFSALVGCSTVCVEVTCSYIYAICDASVLELIGRKARSFLDKEAKMFVSIMDALEEKGYVEGIAEGTAKGKVEGKAEGKVDTILVLLNERFGKVPTKAKRRISSASEAQLDVWIRRVLKAKSIDELLADPSSDINPTRHAPNTKAVAKAARRSAVAEP